MAQRLYPFSEIRDVYIEWHDHPLHGPLHWSVFLFVTIFAAANFVTLFRQTANVVANEALANYSLTQSLKREPLRFAAAAVPIASTSASTSVDTVAPKEKFFAGLFGSATSSRLRIEGLHVEKKTATSATIVWVTNVPTSYEIWWGTSEKNMTNTVSVASSTVKHSQLVGGLATSTKYYFGVKAISASSTAASKSTFKTKNK